MKTFKRIFLLFVLFFVYVYIVSIDNIPNEIEIFKGEKVNISTLWGISIKKENNSIQTSTALLVDNTFENTGTETLEVTLFDKITIKKIDVSVLDEVEVIPSGEIVGIKLYTSGVLVVGTSSIEGNDGQYHKPFSETDIKEGDSIVAINDNIVNNTKELINSINESNGNKIKITYVREENQKECEIIPVKDKSNEYKIGLWVRDSAAGVGTVTFYNQESESFAALGHPITDIDTGDIINTSSGEIDDANIISIVKGIKEQPGKVQGSIKDNSTIGNIYKNTKYGIYGVIKNLNNLNLDYSKKMKVASRQEIQVGPASFLSAIDGEIKEYDIEIEKIYLNNNYDNKSMMVRVTDDEILQKTGGIIQGMSGSPIIQNGKFIGAITHVFVSDPQSGYAVFGDTMVKQLGN